MNRKGHQEYSSSSASQSHQNSVNQHNNSISFNNKRQGNQFKEYLQSLESEFDDNYPMKNQAQNDKANADTPLQSNMEDEESDAGAHMQSSQQDESMDEFHDLKVAQDYNGIQKQSQQRQAHQNNNSYNNHKTQINAQDFKYEQNNRISFVQQQQQLGSGQYQINQTANATGRESKFATHQGPTAAGHTNMNNDHSTNKQIE